MPHVPGLAVGRRFQPARPDAVPILRDAAASRSFPRAVSQNPSRPECAGRAGRGRIQLLLSSAKKAVVPCAGCGRFLCALCDCELNGQHFCPACLETGKSKGKIKTLENQRTRYDTIALGLAILPVLIFYLTIVTAPMTLFVAIRYWNAPQSIVRRTRFRFILAIVIALLQIGGWTAFFILIATSK